MVFVSIWSAKGKGRVGKDQKVGDDEKLKESMPLHYASANLAAIQPYSHAEYSCDG